MNKAIEHFQSAIEEDPTYAPAYAGLSDCYGLHGNGRHRDKIAKRNQAVGGGRGQEGAPNRRRAGGSSYRDRRHPSL